YGIGENQDQSGYLHALWNRSNPLQRGATHAILTAVQGQGQYVGTTMAWGVNNSGWWGEGEIKFYLDGDCQDPPARTAQDFPTICGTGTEDYCGGAWNFDVPGEGYTAFTTPYLGLHQI